ncbi:MAG: phosphotransferase family protein [Actinomycetota bacterium]|nr:phosphotransferase family protein [Actinomycetota bacterium]
MNEIVGGEPAELHDIQLIAGGRSNLTYRLAVSGPAGDRSLVLRRPPLGHVLPTAHDMSREYRVLTALSGTQVPVARPVAFCDDDDVIGAPFYLMEHVPGVVLRTRQDTAGLTEPQARGLSEGLADMLAAIHGVDVDAVGLASLGRGAGYLSRQLGRWQRQWDLSVTRDVPGYAELVARLTDRLPPEGETTLVHGDFRLDNVLVTVSPQPRITAVVDWEMATLGDPLADLGLTLVYWTDPDEEGWLTPEQTAAATPLAAGVSTDATASPGFLSRAEFAAGYAQRTGRDVSRIEYYIAFGYFKLAVVLEGINARYLKHQTVGEGFDSDGLAVPALVTRAHEVLDADL